MAERILCHFSSDNFEQYTFSIHGSIGQCFCNRAVANIFFNHERKLSTVEGSNLEIFITLNFYFIFSFITLSHEFVVLPFELEPLLSLCKNSHNKTQPRVEHTLGEKRTVMQNNFTLHNIKFFLLNVQLNIFLK